VKKKLKIFCLIGLFYFCIFTSCFNLNTKAQDEEYKVGFPEGTELIWEVIDLNLLKFVEIFGFEPNFEIGDQNRMIIREIYTVTLDYIIEVEFWDYKTDWGLSGESITLNIKFGPEYYDDYLFSLSPVEGYLTEAIAALPTDYYKVGLSLFKQGKSETGFDYLWEKQFDTRGILITEIFYDEFDQIIVKLEGTFLFIPFGMSFIGFTILAIIAIIVVFIKKKSLRIKVE
jgi:hypothetical protein